MSLLFSKDNTCPLLLLEVLETILVSILHCAFYSGTCHPSLLYSSYSLSSRCRADPQNRIKKPSRGAWVAQSVGCLTLAQVMISRFVTLSPTSGSVLTAQLPGACFRFCVSLCLCSSPTRTLSLSLSLSLSLKNK